ncbi:MAG: hypothetical protein RJB01_1425 [Actinomycetota bacterium]
MKNLKRIGVITATSGLALAIALGGTNAAIADDNGQRGGGPLKSLVTDGTLTSAQVTAIKSALQKDHEANRAEHQAEMEQARKDVIADLVAKGTITNAQGDAILAADKGGMRDLIANGTISQETLAAVRDALRAGKEADRTSRKAEMKAERDKAIDGLVTAGTLTSAEATSVKTALDTAGPKGGGHKGMGGKGQGKQGGMKGGRMGGSGARA